MRRRRPGGIDWRPVAGILLLLASGVANAEPGRNPPSYSFGVVPQFDQRRILAHWGPILKRLSERTGYQFRLAGSPTIPDFEDKFMAGQFDCAYMNPYHLIKAHMAQGYVPLVRDHSRVLRGIVVVQKASTLRSLADLAGKSIVFPAPNALGASLLVRAELADAGIAFLTRYVRNHSSVYLHVARGLAAAGGGVRTTLLAQANSVQGRLRVIYRTDPVVPHPVACHPRVPEEHRVAIQKAFLALGQSKALQAHFAGIPMIEPGEAAYGEYAPLVDKHLERLYGRK